VGARTIALVTDLLEDPNNYSPGVCGHRRCQALLYHHVVQAVLTSPTLPAFGAPPDAAMKVTRHRVERRPWCPPNQRMDDFHDGRNLDFLAHQAEGECLVAEPATLAEADVIIVEQALTPRRRPDYHTVHEALVGERLTVYRKNGEHWQEIHRETQVGGSDWFVPMLIGPLDRSLFAAMMGLGGGVIGFMTAHTVEPSTIDFDAWLKRWGLSASTEPTVSNDDMARLVRSILANPAIPAASASMQFSASYAWLGGWETKDMATVAAIIGDPRVTDFAFADWQATTPLQLAQPILERVLKTDLSPTLDQATLSANREAIARLAAVFSLLPHCSVAPQYPMLKRIADDEERAPYAAAMLTRLADAGATAVPDLQGLIELGLRMGHEDDAKKDFIRAHADVDLIIAMLKALQKLGLQAKPAAPTVIAVLKDGDSLSIFSSPYAPVNLRLLAAHTLLTMGETEALRQLRREGRDTTDIERFIPQLHLTQGEGCTD